MSRGTTKKMKMTFKEWLAKVDAIIAKKMHGLTSGDLPDCCYRDWYDDGVKPASAASRAIKGMWD